MAIPETSPPDPVAVLIGRLRAAGATVDATDLADALWLAGCIGTGLAQDDAPPTGVTADARDVTGSGAPDMPSLAHALRPLRGYGPWTRPSGKERNARLDEAGTARTHAAGACTVPVFRRTRSGQARMQLLVDDSLSMSLWDPMVEELRHACEQAGVFRSVTVHRLRPHPDGEAGVLHGSGETAWLGPAGTLRDVSGHTVTLLLSDCSGPLWHHGAAQRLIHRRLGTGPLAVVQPLPARLWSDTSLPTESGTLRLMPGPSGALAFSPLRSATPPSREQRPLYGRRLPFPVLPPTSDALGGWARLLSGRDGGALAASVAWAGARDEGAVPRSRPAHPPERLIQEFRSVASAEAQRLAVFLSAAPLSIPVMRFVQHSVLPAAGPGELAEVLCGGLLEPMESEADEAWYEFVPGVRELLLRELELDEARTVLEHCSIYVDRVFGRRARNVPAMVLGHLTGASVDLGGTADGPVPRPFADVPRDVLRRFQPSGIIGPPAGRKDSTVRAVADSEQALAKARSHLRRFEQRGGISDLWEAVRTLRAAARTVETATLLAECLVALWDLHRDRGALQDAEDAARAALTLIEPDLARAHFVLGKVMRAESEAAPDAETRAAVLTEAADSLERAYSLLRSDPRPLLDVLLCVVEVVRERYRLGGDRRLLYGAQVRLDALLEGWPGDQPLPGSALLARGGLLMALSENARLRDSFDESRALAVQAAADFEQAAALATQTEEPRTVVCRARLELAEARAVVAGDRGAAGVVSALTDALRTAGDTGELRLRGLWRLAEAHTERWTRTADPTELDTADGYFAQAQAELPADDPRRPRLLTARGGALLSRAEASADVTAATNAVRVLRAALAQTPESDAELPARLLLFGRALHQHHRSGGTLTDLHEAEWLLSRAARGARAAGDTTTEAHAWLERGDGLLVLAHAQSATSEYEDRAAESYRRAAAATESSADHLLAARAMHRRGTVLERTAGPARALDAYRTAWSHWQASGQTRGAEGRETLGRMRALSGPAV